MNVACGMAQRSKRAPVLNGGIRVECYHNICKSAFVILRLAELYSITRAHT